MLGKLFKHDFEWINKVMIIYYIIAFFSAICVRIVESFEKTVIVVIIDKVLSGVFIACIVSIVINCLMRIWVRYRYNIYKDESYLTHTLPVTKSQIFNAKILASIISIVISIFVIALCLLIVCLNDTTITTIKTTFENLVEVYGQGRPTGMIVALIFILIFEILYMMFAGIFGITIGHSANNYKILKSVIVGIVSYGFLSSLILVILFIVAQINPTMMELYKEGLPSPESFEWLIYVSLAVYTVYNLIYYFASKKILEKGVNVD